MQHIKIGLSGCQIQLINDSVIRKISPSEIYNRRLEKQYEKQRMFSQMHLDHIITPRPLNSGYIDKLFYFDMEYVNGKLFNDEFQLSSLRDLTSYTTILLNYLKYCQSNPQECKYNEIKAAIINKLIRLHDVSDYKPLIRWTLKFAEQADFSKVTKTFCHGDLTLSNILFVDTGLCFLDFLDSYIDSYFIDIVKLKQDFYYGWGLNTLPINDVYALRTKQILTHLWHNIEQEYKDIINTEAFQILDLINYLRIEPYVKATENQNILDRIIKETEVYDKFNHSNGRATKSEF